MVLVFPPLSQKVLEAFNNGDIEIIWNNTEKVGVAMPFIVRRKSDGKIVSTIFINAFATIKDDSILVIPAKQLYGLMEGAYIALKLQTDPVKGYEKCRADDDNCFRLY